MESTHTQTAYREQSLNAFDNQHIVFDDVQERLDALLEANAAIARQKALFKTEREWFEAEIMQRPVNTEKAFSYLGLMLGTLPPASFFIKFAIDSRVFESDGAWFVIVLLFVNAATATAGYFSGKFIGRAARQIETYRWPTMLAIAPLLGILWGMIAGGAGGLIIFLIGAFFGAVIGGIVGAVALPVFAVFHRMLKRGDVIEYKHFLPLALGITLTICSFILGL
ncbi:MAG TPA: hypothetical protein VL325_04555 [Pyrinomonadaceae bacterium]|nr:hypothetical protein [Pyrinomonadaceae bacterium]